MTSIFWIIKMIHQTCNQLDIKLSNYTWFIWLFNMIVLPYSVNCILLQCKFSLSSGWNQLQMKFAFFCMSILLLVFTEPYPASFTMQNVEKTSFMYIAQLECQWYPIVNESNYYWNWFITSSPRIVKEYVWLFLSYWIIVEVCIKFYHSKSWNETYTFVKNDKRNCQKIWTGYWIAYA